jgi:CHAT domain-containing protein
MELSAPDTSESRLAMFSGAEGLLLEATLERAVADHPSAENLHARGLLFLFQGRSDEAVQTLQSARLEDPAGADLAADLAAALLGPEASTRRRIDALLAAEAAYQATALDPRAPTARFNLALALERIPLPRRSRQAWEDYLDLDPSSRWAQEAREHLQVLSQPTEAERWTSVIAALSRSSASAGPASGEIAAFPSQAFQEVERNLFPEWAHSSREGRPARAQKALALARRIGLELATLGDELVVDAVAAAETESRGTGTRVPLANNAAGILDLEEALRLKDDRNCGRALSVFTRARRELVEGQSPLAEWSALNRAICLYLEQEVSAAQTELLAVHERVVGRRYPRLLGRVEWMLGLSLAARGDYANALGWYRSALPRFDRVGDNPSVAGVLTLIAEAQRKLGQPAASWSSRLSGLGRITRSGDLNGVTRALEESLSGLLEEGRLELAVLFQDELVAEAQAWEDSVTALPAALLKRGELLRRLGDMRRADRDLSEAATLVQLIPEAGTRARLSGDIAVEQARGSIARSPAEAVQLLTKAIDDYKAAGHPTRVPALLRSRAHASLALGRPGAAEADLMSAIDRIEDLRELTMPGDLRASFFETAQGTFDDLVKLLVEERNEPRRALEYADRARGRGLQDLLSKRPSDPQSASSGTAPPRSQPDLVTRVQAALLDGHAVIEYAVLPDRLLIWSLRHDRFEVRSLPVTATDLAARVASLRDAIERGEVSERIEERAAQIYDDVLLPVRPMLNGVTTLWVVPDRFLYKVPFGALFDRRTGRYLIEDSGVAILPSASQLRPETRRSPQAAAGLSALVIGSPNPDPALFGDLPRLPGAEAEGREVAALYTSASLLLGPAATRPALLAELPAHPVLHLATHVLVDPEAPSRTVIVLSPSDAEDRGALQLSDLDLEPVEAQRPEVVFLSACTTASAFPGGQREGMAGLVRLLLGANVPTVIASLWRVEDDAARELAIAFHRRLAAGDTAGEALRAAQLSLLYGSSRVRSSPADWAVFQVYGDSTVHF